MNEQEIEQEIQAAGLTAPRLQPEDLTANIVDTEFVTHVSKGGQVLRWAVLTTRSGFAVTGKPSVAVSPENDNEKIGRQVAYDNARNELWPLMGYELKERLAAEQNVRQRPAKTAESITFDAFVQFGRDNGANIVNGMPWSFQYKGYGVTHENDQRYLVCRGGETLNFTPDQVLVTGADGNLFLREA